MAQSRSGNRALRVYLATVIVAGTASIAWAFTRILTEPPPHEWLFLVALTLLTGSFNIKVPSLSARISVSEALVFIAIFALGPAPATILVALDATVVTLRLKREQRSTIRTLFNTSSGSLAIWLSGNGYLLLVDTPPGTLAEFLFPAAVLSVCYFAVNSVLIAFAISLERGMSALTLWRHNFLWIAVNYLGSASVAVLFVVYARDLDWAVVGVFLPLLVLVYLAFRTSMARLQDAHEHVAQLNELHLSTIEALAMAVDAKDQITHGHIRRVQLYTAGLARELGISNESQLQAIQAAALLHDMGKLAIPEHILNKPGRLSPAEFEKIKEHANIGADLIGSIKFPYPVVPIVRHHHENWDGSGYPSGLSGPDIPLGARILSVVDCFDALTSDRPYRPALSTEAAFDILRERRGTMYDPFVVDTFIASHTKLASLASADSNEASEGSGLETSSESSLDNRGEVATDYVAVVGKSSLPHELARQVLDDLLHETGAGVTALFEYDVDSDSLVCSCVGGRKNLPLSGLRIPLGERVSGWSAANRRPALNSDAALDLREIARVHQPSLRSALCVPVVAGERLLGTVSAYATAEAAFSQMDQWYAECAAARLLDGFHGRQLAPVLGTSKGTKQMLSA